VIFPGWPALAASVVGRSRSTELCSAGFLPMNQCAAGGAASLVAPTMTDDQLRFTPTSSQALTSLVNAPSEQDLFVDQPSASGVLLELASPVTLEEGQSSETKSQLRRRQRIALVEEFGGPGADFRKVALEAVKRGMYSRRTNLGDIEAALLRTWKHRRRNYNR
jgi:hypothetical protein